MLVLVAEDDASIRRSLQAVLEDEGYQVVGVAHGGEALEWLRQHQARPDLILVDLMMPVMDGSHFIEQVAGDPELSAIPVAIMSASTGDDVARRLPHARAYLRKPVPLARLLSFVESYRPH